MSQLAYRKHLQRQVVFGARILKQRARRFNFMRCGNRWNVRLRNVRLTSTRWPDAITWEGGGVCFDPDAGLWPSGRLSSAPMCRQSFP